MPQTPALKQSTPQPEEKDSPAGTSLSPLTSGLTLDPSLDTEYNHLTLDNFPTHDPGAGWSFMLVGDAGVGKTRFCSTFPRPYFLDLDKGTASIRRTQGSWGKTTIKDLSAKTSVKAQPARGVFDYGKGWMEFLKSMESIANQMAKGTWPYLTIVWDSMTMLQQLAMNNTLSLANRPGAQPQLQDYGGILNAMKTAADMFVSMPGFKIMTAHVERSVNPLTTAVEKLPLGMGQFPALASMFFDEIYFMDSKDKKSKDGEVKTSRVLITMQTSVIKAARTRIDLPDGTEAHFANLAPYLNLPAAS